MENEVGQFLEVIKALGGFGGLAALLALWWDRRSKAASAEKIEADAEKTKAEADKIKAEKEEKTLDTAFRLINVLNTQINELGRRIDEQECSIRNLRKTVDRYAKRIEYLMRGIRILLGQLEEQKIQPSWEPDDWSPEEEDIT